MENHPSKQILERLLAETLDDDQRTNVEAHLENCGQCQTTLHNLTLGDSGSDSSISFVSMSSRASRGIDAESETFFQRLRRIPAPASGSVAEPASDPLSGQADSVCIEGYELLEELGRGAFGVVYRARDRKLNRLVALKVIHAGPRLSPEAKRRFLAEAMTIARLKHANIIQIYAVGEQAGSPFLSLELVEGGNLADWMNGKPQPVLDCIRIASSLAQAIDYAHHHGVVHRDLKPANVLFIAAADRADKREIKITDFGIAKVLPEQGLAEAGMTQTNEILGTPAYMAPEQANGKASQICPATDVYAIGAIFYELLTGRPPFQGVNTLDTLMQALWQDPVPVRLLVPRVPRDLETICAKCLQKDPRRRYPSAAALADDLHRFETGEPITARPAGLAERAIKWIRRHPSIAVAVTAAVLTILMLLGGALWMISQRASTAAAVEGDLKDAISYQQQSDWTDADAALYRATVRLTGHQYGDLSHRLDLAGKDSDLAARFEAIYLKFRESADPAYEHKDQTDRDYADAFRDAGLGTEQEQPQTVAARARNSNIRLAIVAALDSWTTFAAEGSEEQWVVDVARGADIDPDGWRASTRQLWNDGPALANATSRFTGTFGLAERAKLKAEPVSFLLALESRLKHLHQDHTKFLMRVQQTHPSDFLVNELMGDRMLAALQPAQAIGFYQAALASHPEFVPVRNNLGIALRNVGRFDEAIDQFNQAIQLAPANSYLHANLGLALARVGRPDEGIAELEKAIREDPERSLLYYHLADVLMEVGRNSDAMERLRQALARHPKNDQRLLELSGLRQVLTRMGRDDETMSVWRQMTAEYPDSSQAWSGYPDYCLYHGREDDYQRARRSVLTLFGHSTDPNVCARMARACLLKPTTEGQLKLATAMLDRALAADSKEYGQFLHYFLFVKGLTEYRAGHFESAESIMAGPAADAQGPAPRLVLAMAQFRLGELNQARRTLAQAMVNFTWDPADDVEGQVYHVLRREAEAMMLPNMAAFLRGEYQPADNNERLALIGVCEFENRQAQLARLWSDAFAADPSLAAGHRYNAACAAALAGCGNGADAANLSDVDRAQWRQQARQWLAADLDSCQQQVQRGGQDLQDARQTLSAWFTSKDLACIRDTSALAKLPAEERSQWTLVWQRVGDLLQRARSDQPGSQDPDPDSSF